MLALPVLALTVSLAAAPSAEELEAHGRARVTSEFDRVGRAAPLSDPALQVAARKLAAKALVWGAEDAADPIAISNVVSEAGGFDANPRAVVVRASPAEYALDTFDKRDDFNQEPATHLGIGAAVVGDEAVIVALLADRKATLRTFPRRLPSSGGTRTLCGELLGALRAPDVYVTRPSGEVDRYSGPAGSAFCLGLPFSTPGRHNVEVIGKGPRGPEVAAMFAVDVGESPPGDARYRPAEPRTTLEARPLILARVNALREAQHAGAVGEDTRLEVVAQAYADRMARENFFAHVAPDGSDLRFRLTRSGYTYERAGENLGLASGPLAAHFAIEHSPGHRKNLLDPDFTRFGCGVAFQRVGDRTQAIVVEILARPAVAAGDPLIDAYRALAERRSQHRLPALSRSEVLEEIALSHVRKALALDLPRAQLPGSSVHERVFTAVTQAELAAVDFFVADQPGALPDSKSVADPRYDHVGIGAIRGDSATYGPQKYWVLVIYTASRQTR